MLLRARMKVTLALTNFCDKNIFVSIDIDNIVYNHSVHIVEDNKNYFKPKKKKHLKKLEP